MRRNLRHGAVGERLRLKSIAKVVAREAARRGLLGRESERYGARRGTQSFGIGESGFMRQ